MLVPNTVRYRTLIRADKNRIIVISLWTLNRGHGTGVPIFCCGILFRMIFLKQMAKILRADIILLTKKSLCLFRR
jgi:hypothetical protein